LDKEEPVSDLDKSPPSDHDGRVPYNSYEAMHSTESTLMLSARADPDQYHNHDEEDSSNDDSSYFASHLPEPNSGRRYSWASNTSQNSVTQQQQQQPQRQLPTQKNASPNRTRIIHGRESDASLSLSDDSDDNMVGQQHPVLFGPQQGVYNQNAPYYHPQYVQGSQQPRDAYPMQPNLYPQQMHFQPSPLQHQHQQQQTQTHQFILPPPRTGGVVPELYPEQIMPRMHSINSLASTSSHNSSGSDTSLPDELQIAVSSEQRRMLNRGSSNNSHLPSGRRSPILGEHPPSRGGGQQLAIPPFGSPSSVNLQPSPPLILHSFSAGTSSTVDGGGDNDGKMQLPHPQPHSMTAEQLALWTASTTQNLTNYNTSDQQIVMIGNHQPYSTTQGGTNSFPVISGSRGESDFLYSGDSDTNFHQQQPSNHAFGEPNRGKVSHPEASRSLQSLSWEESLRQGPVMARERSGIDHAESTIIPLEEDRGFKVYWQRWIMLMVSHVLFTD
jgi:hypothetical protein